MSCPCLPSTCAAIHACTQRLLEYTHGVKLVQRCGRLGEYHQSELRYKDLAQLIPPSVCAAAAPCNQGSSHSRWVWYTPSSMTVNTLRINKIPRVTSQILLLLGPKTPGAVSSAWMSPTQRLGPLVLLGGSAVRSRGWSGMLRRLSSMMVTLSTVLQGM